MKTREKHTVLVNILKELGSVAIAYSGGVDSTYLMKAAHDALGGHMVALTARACLFPEREMAEAVEYCSKEGIRQVVVDFDALGVEGFAENPSTRCYICKSALMKSLKAVARENGMRHVAEGSNTDDESDYRPGMVAVKEQGIVSPLREAGLSKSEIRELSREMGLPTWDKPSFACLASRFPYGEIITAKRLKMVEEAERMLMDMGIRQVRVRRHGDVARIEADGRGFELIADEKHRTEIYERFKKIGFQYVSLDLIGYRTGSMNEALSE